MTQFNLSYCGNMYKEAYRTCETKLYTKKASCLSLIVFTKAQEDKNFIKRTMPRDPGDFYTT